MTWQTKLLATFIAATVAVEKEGDVNPLLEAAKKIGEPHTPAEAAKEPAEVDNGNASYERFLSSFGSPARWAGR